MTGAHLCSGSHVVDVTVRKETSTTGKDRQNPFVKGLLMNNLIQGRDLGLVKDRVALELRALEGVVNLSHGECTFRKSGCSIVTALEDTCTEWCNRG